MRSTGAIVGGNEDIGVKLDAARTAATTRAMTARG